jgi:heme exporter protein A
LVEALMAEHCTGGGMIVMTSHHDVNLHDINVVRIRLSE